MARVRVCLVDDDIFVRDALALGLNDAGYDVVTAPGAAAGFDIARRQEVDVVVTDMNMPGTGGAQFIAELRLQWPTLPIVAISGAASIDGRDTSSVALELGANETLIKPFRARQLAAVISSLVNDGGAAPS